MQLIKFVPWLSVVLVAVVLIAFRAHYSIDIPIGILVGIEAGMYACVIDRYGDSLLKRAFCRRKWIERMREWNREQQEKEESEKSSGRGKEAERKLSSSASGNEMVTLPVQ